MIDSFTKERAEQYFVKNRSQGSIFTVSTWIQKQKFFVDLNKKYQNRAEQLGSAMTNYCNRIISRLQLPPIYKIQDNLQQIVEYIASIPAFIRRFLLNSSKANPPFQVELLIAVRGVKSQLAEETHPDTDDDDDDETEDETTSKLTEMDPTFDHIGNVQNEFKEIPIYYTPPIDTFEITLEEEKNKEESADEIIIRALGQRYNDFRNVLSGEYNKDKDTKSKPLGKSKQFDVNTYPQRS